ncbi:unnamed protein product [Closterium sp. Naga37s-1]|nr:unnamed protein product [Closterium sp. Naga37s-1]
MNPAPLGRVASRPAALGRVGRIRLLLVALGGAMILSGLRFVNRTTNLVAPASDEFANFTSFGKRLRGSSSPSLGSSSSSSTDITSDTSTSSSSSVSSSSSSSSSPNSLLNAPALQSQPIAAVPLSPNTSQPDEIPAVQLPGNGFQISGIAVRLPPSKYNAQEAGSNQIGNPSGNQVDPAEDPVLALQRAVKPEGIKWPLLAVTPTHARAMQVVYFIRLAAYLRSLGPLVLWIVIEAPLKTEETAELLKQHAGACLPAGDASCRRINYVHLETRRVETSKWNKAVLQRNAALDFIRERRIQGVVYFMDDDNAYLPQLFLEFQSIQNVGVFPVGFLYPDEYSRRNRHIHHTPTVERPLVKRTESGGLQVYGWETFEWFISKAKRKFNVDMGGFAFRSELLWQNRTDLPGYPHHPLRFEASWQGSVAPMSSTCLLPPPCPLPCPFPAPSLPPALPPALPPPCPLPCHLRPPSASPSCWHE